MFAMIRLGNRQFKVKAGDLVRVPFQDKPASSQIEIPVLAFISEEELNFKPSELKDSKLKAEVVRQTLGKKILVFKKKRRKGYRKTRGFRPKTTELRILEIKSPDGKVFKALEKKPPKKIKEQKISAKKRIEKSKSAPKKQIQSKVKATVESKKGEDFPSTSISRVSSSTDFKTTKFDLKKKDLKKKEGALDNKNSQDWQPLISSDLSEQETEKTSTQPSLPKTEPETKPSPLNKESAKQVVDKKKTKDEHPAKPAKAEGEVDKDSDKTSNKDKSDKKGQKNQENQTEKKPSQSEKRKDWFLTEQSKKFLKKPLLWAKKKTGRRSGR